MTENRRLVSSILISHLSFVELKLIEAKADEVNHKGILEDKSPYSF